MGVIRHAVSLLILGFTWLIVDTLGYGTSVLFEVIFAVTYPFLTIGWILIAGPKQIEYFQFSSALWTFIGFLYLFAIIAWLFGIVYGR